MSKRFRFFIVLLVLVIAGVFLYPTINWYFMVPQEKKDIALGSREQIRNYAMSRAARELDRINELARLDSNADVPREYQFLVRKARANNRLTGRDMPSRWTIGEVLLSFGTQERVFRALEAYYRDEIFALQDRSNGIIQLGLDLSGGMSVLLRADMESLRERLGHAPSAEDRRNAIAQAIEILNTRVDRFGVTEPVLRSQGDTHILIEIPGAVDPERVNAFLMGAGGLNFHIVDDEATARAMAHIYEYGIEALHPDTGQPLDPTIIPAGVVLREFVQRDEYGINRVIRYVAIMEIPGLHGDHIVNAQVGTDHITGRPVINFILDREGSQIFAQLTSANTQRTMAIVLDNQVKAGATITEAITGGQVRMTGFGREEANALALILRTASLPFELTIESQQAVGASLGEDLIRAGLKAIMLGFILVVIFMILYYKGAGLIADIALVMNLFLMMAILSAFNMTLTMTSIAGLILTVGMAVDANVIIFERIKEELRAGKTAEAAVNMGYKKAFWTIMDSNLTSLIAVIFLSQLGTGPIQGFAYVLAVGIVCSMFTALFVTRLIFDFSLTYFGKKHLSISWRIK
ncbi:MAG: protein translocase subunit SecD [Spirochaetes bacterium]|nr:protein translocase subunit SecD [Spirochaetota bacterium]